MVGYSVKDHMKKPLTASYSYVQIAVGVSGVRGVRVLVSALALDDQDPENRSNQKMHMSLRAWY